MRNAMVLAGTALVGLVGVTASATASAQQEVYVQTAPPPAQGEVYVRSYVPAPDRALELQVGTGYTQGFGNIFPNTAIVDVAGAGVGFTGSVGYRANPLVSIDVEGQYQAFTAENDSSAQGVNVNLGVTGHTTPAGRLDPWLRIASGWRAVWQTSPTGPFGFVTTHTTNMFHGWEVVNARVGLDVRTSSGVAWAPVVGADLQTFFWENGVSLPTTQWGTFIYAGVQGRFDIGGRAVPAVAMVTR